MNKIAKIANVKNARGNPAGMISHSRSSVNAAKGSMSGQVLFL